MYYTHGIPNTEGALISMRYHARYTLLPARWDTPFKERSKLQALVYDILPSTTAVFSYAIGPRKLSANEQFFVSAQTAVSLLQTTQIISDICFITDFVAYASSDKTQIV